MGEARMDALRLDYDRKLKLEFHGTKVTSDAGLLTCRDFDEALGLTSAIVSELHDNRTGKNMWHNIAALLRQSIYRRCSMLAQSNWIRRTLTVTGLGIMLVVILIGASSCYTTGHPMPWNDEIYEVKDPDTHKRVLRLVATMWGDETYKEGPLISFNLPDGTIWRVNVFFNEPEYWEVVRIHPEKGAQKIAPNKIYTGSAGSIRKASPFMGIKNKKYWNR